MGGPLVFNTLYSSKRYTLVGLGSAKNEYTTLTHTYKWVMWLSMRNLLQKDGLSFKYGHLVANPTLMLGDNAQADRWAQEAMITNLQKSTYSRIHKIKEGSR